LGETFLTGLGLGLGLGWLWYPALQAPWPPGVLRGPLFAGDGSPVFPLLMIGGLGVCALVSELRNSTGPPAGTAWADCRLGTQPHLFHAAALIFLALALFPDWPAAGLWPYLPLLALTLAALPLGLFWGGALLILPAVRIGWALAVSAVGATALYLLADLIPAPYLDYLLFFSVAEAWRTAARLSRLLRVPRPEPRRPRGRPPKKEDRAAAGPSGEKQNKRSLLLGATAFFLTALISQGVDAAPYYGWLVIALPGLGSLSAVLSLKLPEAAAARRSPENCGTAASPGRQERHLLILLSLALALQGLGWLLLPGFFGYPSLFLRGLITALAVGLWAQTPPERAWPRAAIFLALTMLLSKLGAAAGSGLQILLEWNAWSDIVHRPALRLGGMIESGAALALLARLSPRGPLACGGPERGREAAGDEKTAGAGGPPLTAREEEIMTLLALDCSNKQIAARLHVQEGTVRFHLRNIYQKSGLTKREEILQLARRRRPPLAPPAE
jgi:DNA-binding CsgD family transcriptional regulator